MVLSSIEVAKVAEPKKPSDLVLPNSIRALALTILQEDAVRYTVHGPAGCGKSTFARMYLRMLKSRHPNAAYLIMDASHNNGVKDIRENLRDKVRQRNMKCVVLEECDNMTTEAQESLRNLIGDSSRHVSFILVCNDAQKLTAAIKSRAPLLYFGDPEPEHIMARLMYMAEKLGLPVTAETEDRVRTIMQHYKGDMRAAIKMMNFTELDLERMRMFMPAPDVNRILVPDVAQREQVIKTWEAQGVNPMTVFDALKDMFIKSMDRRLTHIMAMRFNTVTCGEGFTFLRCALFQMFP